MSRPIFDAAGLEVVAFWGGEQRGNCIEITVERASGQTAMLYGEVEDLVEVLKRWLDEKARHRGPADGES